MNESNELILPIPEREILRALQAHLKEEFKKHFKEASLAQSDNCYVSFQIYEFPGEIVRYLSVDSCQFYEEAFDEIVKIVKEVVRNHDAHNIDVGNVIRDIVEKMVLSSANVRKIIPKGNPSYEAEFKEFSEQFKTEKINPAFDQSLTPQAADLETIKDEINKICSINPQISWNDAKDFTFVKLLQKILRTILEGLEQSLQIGLAREVYEGSSKNKDEIIEFKDITRVQRKNLKSDSALPGSSVWSYLFITNIERFFFVGGFRRDKRSSFVLFAPLYMYGQRLGYMFVIESYSGLFVRVKKMREAKKFLKEQKEHGANFLKEYRERKFWAKIAKDLRESNNYSDESFCESLKLRLPFLVNILDKEVKWESFGSQTKRDVSKIAIYPSKINGKYIIEIPIRIQENDGGPITELGLMRGTINEFEGKALQQEEHLQALARTLSTTAGLFILNRQIQEMARDAEWKTIVDEMSHSMAFPFGEIHRRLHETGIYIDRNNSSGAKDQLRRAEAVVNQLSEINKFLFYLVKASETTRDKWDEPMRVALEIKDNESLGTLFDDCFENISSSIPLLQLSTNSHARLIETKLEQFKRNTVTAFEKITVRCIPSGLKIVLGDLLKNALKETDEQNPAIDVSFVKDFNEAFHAICFKNNKTMTQEAYIFLLKGLETPSMSKSRKVGWRTIKRILAFEHLVDTHNRCDYHIDPSSTDQSVGETTIFLLLPKEVVNEHAK